MRITGLRADKDLNPFARGPARGQPMIRCLLPAVVLACSCGWLSAKDRPPAPDLPSPESVMTRAGDNQDRAQAERAHYIYVQHAKTISRHGKTVKCEEITDYRISPSSDGYHQQLLNLDGRQLTNHKYLPYHARPVEPVPPDSGDKPKNDTDPATIPVTISEDSIDRDIVQDMRWNLTHDKSKDGISAHLFPLTTKDQADYTFRMVGRERMNDHDVFHIAFRPKKKDDFGWSGDAYIDTQAYQPVLITTVMARKLPLAVRTLMGTNLPGLGFTVTYAPQPDGVWFPVTFSTEFKIHVLFFFNREIILDARNRDFERTHVTSRIVGEATAVQAQPE